MNDNAVSANLDAANGHPATKPAAPAPTPLERHRFRPGQSGNPSGRPKRERAYLARIYGADGRKVFERLEQLRQDPKTPRRVKADIDKFIIERMFGKAPQMLGVEGGPSLLSLLAEVTARTVPGVKVEP